MPFRKISRCFCCVVLMISPNLGSAASEDGVFTASIDSRGKVLAKSSEWISAVKVNPRSGYYSTYKIAFETGVFKKAPAFCAVSVTDVDTFDDIFYAHAKLAGTPTSSSVQVVTHLVGSLEKDYDSSKSFMLMCIQ
jgi:hypothetical protein